MNRINVRVCVGVVTSIKFSLIREKMVGFYWRKIKFYHYRFRICTPCRFFFSHKYSPTLVEHTGLTDGKIRIKQPGERICYLLELKVGEVRPNVVKLCQGQGIKLWQMMFGWLK